MCLILFSYHAHPTYPLIVAANRDEAYARASAAAAFWNDDANIFGGRDLEQGGTWLACTRAGHIAAVTNFRDGQPRAAAPRSRGEIAARFLVHATDAGSYFAGVRRIQQEYNGFCALAGNLDALYFFSNRGNGVERVMRGVHGLSNHLLDTPWPKVTAGRAVLQDLPSRGEDEIIGKLFDYLGQRSWAPDAALPDTGIGMQRERELSPAFVAGDRYGTRASTVVLIGKDGDVFYEERSFGAAGRPLGRVTQRFRVETRFPNPV